jgi:hypothetical protein
VKSKAHFVHGEKISDIETKKVPLAMQENKHKNHTKRTDNPQPIRTSLPGRHYFGLFVCSIPIVLLVYLILHSGVNVCILDQFNAIVPLFEKLHSGQLTFADLWERHNEHIIFFPSIIMLALGTLTRYNSIAEMFFTAFLLTLICIMYAAVVQKQFTIKFKNFPIWFFPAALLNFSWVQSENMLWGFQISFVLTLTAAVTSLFLLYYAGKTARGKSSTLFFILAVTAATIASFSSSMGISIWIAGFIPLCAAGFSRKRTFALGSMFFVLGIIVWMVFITGYSTPSGHPSIAYVIDNPLEFIHYLTVCFGGAVIAQTIPAMIAGTGIFLTLIITVAVTIKNKRTNANSFWLGLLALSLLNMLCIAVGRAGFGVEQALMSRYTTFAIPGIIAIYCMLNDIRFTRTTKMNTLASLVFGVIMVAGTIAAYFNETKQYATNESAYTLFTYDQQSDVVLMQLFPDPAEIKRDAQILKTLNYNVFASNALQKQYPHNLYGLKPCTLDFTFRYSLQPLNAEIPSATSPSGIIREESALFQGIAYDTKTSTPIGGVYIGIDSAVYPAYYGKTWPDSFVNAAKEPLVRNSGFECAIPLRLINPGKHTVRFMLLSKDRTCYWANPETTEIELK